MVDFQKPNPCWETPIWSLGCLLRPQPAFPCAVKNVMRNPNCSVLESSGSGSQAKTKCRWIWASKRRQTSGKTSPTVKSCSNVAWLPQRYPLPKVVVFFTLCGSKSENRRKKTATVQSSIARKPRSALAGRPRLNSQ